MAEYYTQQGISKFPCSLKALSICAYWGLKCWFSGGLWVEILWTTRILRHSEAGFIGRNPFRKRIIAILTFLRLPDVDVVSAKSLHYYIRERVLAEAKPLWKIAVCIWSMLRTALPGFGTIPEAVRLSLCGMSWSRIRIAQSRSHGRIGK